jgi:hypothetical protein
LLHRNAVLLRQRLAELLHGTRLLLRELRTRHGEPGAGLRRLPDALRGLLHGLEIGQQRLAELGLRADRPLKAPHALLHAGEACLLEAAEPLRRRTDVLQRLRLQATELLRRAPESLECLLALLATLRRELHGEIAEHLLLCLRPGPPRLEPAGGQSRPHLLEHAAGGDLIEILAADRRRRLPLPRRRP